MSDSRVESASDAAPSRTAAVFELGKFRLSVLAIFAVVAGLYLGTPSEPSLTLLITTTLGTLLVAMGGNALNMWLERDLDKHMARTADRPIPSGRLSADAARIAGIVSILVGLGILATFTNALSTVLSATIAITYVGVYTPLKRKTSLNTIVGAVPGALPPVVGYAASSGTLDGGALILFLILFFWQIPHFLAISWHYREDYARSGMKMLPVVDPGGRSTTQQMLLYTAALVFVSFLPFGAHMVGEKYLATAACLNVLFGGIAVVAAIWRHDLAMRQTFYVSIIYLPVLFGVMVLDRAVVL